LEKKLTEAQRIAFFELATQYHQVPRELMASLLDTAVRQKSMGLAGAIVKSAGGVDSLPDKGGQAMVTAARNDWASIDGLLQLGIDINALGENGEREQSTALMEAVKSVKADRTMLTNLLERGASIRLPEGRALLVIALRSCKVPAAALLLERGADPNATDPSAPEIPPLPFAISCTRHEGGRDAHELVRSLLRHGAEPYPKYELPWHPLADVCVRDADPTNFKLLRAAGANINFRDKKGRTALMSDFGDRPNATEKLLQCGINVNARDRRGWTALQYMHQRQYWESVSIMCKHDAQPRELCVAIPTPEATKRS
jgi:ankyrin repeat protein